MQAMTTPGFSFASVMNRLLRRQLFPVATGVCALLLALVQAPLHAQGSNTEPVVDAGSDQTVYTGGSVTLSATATDADNDSLAYMWSHDAPPALGFTLADPTMAEITFTAPLVVVDTPIVFTLDVSDGTASVSSTVTVSVESTADTFITTWRVVDNDTLTITNTPLATGSYTVDWGDASERNTYDCTAGAACNATHTYADGGDYQVVIEGTGFQNIVANAPAGNAAKLLTIEQWGALSWTTMASAFRDAASVQHTATDSPDLARVANMESMFRGAAAFNGEIGDWDVSNVTNMDSMFEDATAFDQDLASWYITLDSLTLVDAATTTTVGTIMAQNTPLDNHSPEYSVADINTDDSALFELGSANTLRLKSSVPPSFASTPSYTVTLTASQRASNEFFGMSPVSRQVRVQVMTTTPMAATGAPAIVGVPGIGNRLRADTTGIFDANGLDAVVYGYQWLRQDDATGANTTAITAATDQSYRLTSEDGGRHIAVRVMFTDDAGNPETLTSAPVGVESIVDEFITTWRVVDNDTITITNTPLTAGSYTVDWGDASARNTYDCTAGVACNAMHTYTAGGNYRVVIEGAGFQNIEADSPLGNAAKLRAIEQWGAVGWTTMASAFRDATTMQHTATDTPDLSRVTNMFEMFRSATTFNADLDRWDVSNVTNMSGMFGAAIAFNGAIDVWDVSNVTAMDSMFFDAQTFNQDIGRWDVSNVTDMGTMFSAAHTFNRDIGGWDVSNVRNMRSMLLSATAFNQDISRWDVSNVADMTTMFSPAAGFSQNQNLALWYITLDSLTIADAAPDQTVGTITAQNTPLDDHSPEYSVADIDTDDSALFEVSSANTLMLKGSEPPSFANTPFYNVTLTASKSASNEFFGMSPASRQVRVQVTTTTQNAATGVPAIVGVPEVGNRLRANTVGILDANGLDDVMYRYEWLRQDDATGVNATAITDATDPSYRLTLEDEGRYITVRVMFTDDTGNLETLTSAAVGVESAADAFITTWQVDDNDTITITNTPLTAGSYTIHWGDDTARSTYDCTAGVACNAMHTYATAGDYRVLIEGAGFQNIVADSPFGNAARLRAINQWGVIGWTTMASAFQNASTMRHTVTDTPDLSRVTNMESMFRGVGTFNGDIGAWDVSNVTNMESMFEFATDFNQDISGWDVSNVTDMSSMFGAAGAFNQNIGVWDTANVTDMSSMFRDAGAFNQNIGIWDVSKVTNMRFMFLRAFIFDQNLAPWYITLDSLTIADGATMPTVGTITAQNTELDDHSPEYSVATTNADDSVLFEVGSDNTLRLKSTTDQPSFASTPNYIVTLTASQRGSDDFFGTSPASRQVRVQITTTDPMAATGAPAIIGTPAVGNRLRVSTDGIFDANGLDAVVYSYQWIRQDDVFATNADDIDGATELTYQLTAADEGRYISVRVMFDDDAGNPETLTSTAVRGFSDASQFVYAGTDQTVYPGATVTLRSAVLDPNNKALIYLWSHGAPPEIGLTTSDPNMESITFTAPAVTIDTPVVFTLAVSDGTILDSDTVTVTIESTADAFITTWRVEASTRTAVIITNTPTLSGGSYTVDWGDGTTRSVYDCIAEMECNAMHGYKRIGDYQVIIEGAGFQNIVVDTLAGNAARLLAIEQWGTIGWTTMASAFRNAVNMQYTATDTPDLARVTDMNAMFSKASAFNGNLDDWDVSDVTNMRSMLKDAIAFNGVIASWNVGNVTNMESMFEFAGAFNQNIGAWDVSNVIGMELMFNGAVAFNQDIGGWDVRNVTSMTGMFGSAEAFNHDIGAWDVRNVTSMTSMFGSAEAFNHDIGAWDVSNVIGMELMFNGAVAFNQDIGGWDVSNVTEMSFMFEDAEAFDQDISRWDVRKVNNMDNMFSPATGFSQNQNLAPWYITLDSLTIAAGATMPTVGTITAQNTPLDNHSPEYSVADTNADDSVLFEIDSANTLRLKSSAPAPSFVSTPFYTVTLIASQSGSNEFFGMSPVSRQVQVQVTTTDRMLATGAPRIVGLPPEIGYRLRVNTADIFDANGLDDVMYRYEWIRQDDTRGTSARPIPGATGSEYVPTAADALGYLVARVRFTDDAGYLETLTSAAVGPVVVAAGTVRAGTDRRVYAGDTVTLVGAAGGFDTDALLYTWSSSAAGLEVTRGQLDAPAGTPTSLTFTAPHVDTATPIVFTFTASAGSRTWIDTVTITVENITAAFITTWRVADNNTVAIANLPATVGSYTVDWGDGSARSAHDCIAEMACDTTHTYTVASNYQDYRVVIAGAGFQNIRVNMPDVGNAARLLRIDQWGAIRWTTMAAAFQAAANMQYNASDTPDLLNVTSMQAMFGEAAAFNGDLDAWDVSNVTSMRGMFGGAVAFNGALGGWNVSRVTDMSGMFAGAIAFAQGLERWDVSRVTDMRSMFAGTARFNGGLGGWDVSNATNMSSMFDGATRFNDSIASWDVSSVTDMTSMFARAAAFNGDLERWNVSRVTDMTSMFAQAAAFNGDLERWDVSNVTNMSSMFDGATRFNGNVAGWDVSRVTDMTSMFARTVAFNQDLGDEWDVARVMKMRSMFNAAVAFNQDIGLWDVSNVTDMSSMFAGAIMFNQDISRWNVRGVTNMGLMFNGATSFDQDLGLWYIQIDTTTIEDGETEVRTIGTIAAQNDALSGQNPMYGVSTASADDSRFFEIISDNSLQLVATETPDFATRPLYRVTLTAEGGLFGSVPASRQVRVQVTTSTETPAAEMPVIIGTPEVGELLSVGTDLITDANGLDNVTYSYQWIRQDDTFGTNAIDIVGATGPIYRLTLADKRRHIAVRVMFDDDAGNPETRTSRAVEEINNPPVVVLGADQILYGGENVTLTAAATDADADPLTYMWSHDAASALGLTLSDPTMPVIAFVAPAVETDTPIVFTFAASDGEATRTGQLTLTVVRGRMAITQGLDALAPGTTVREFEGRVYAIVPGHDAHGGVIDARGVIDEPLHASLAVCVVPGLEVETGVVLNLPCHVGPHLRHLQRPVPVALISDVAPRLHVPHYNSVLYFIDRDTSIIRATQRVYVAPAIGFAVSVQTRLDDNIVLLPLRGPAAAADYTVEITFAGGGSAPVVSFNEHGQAQADVMLALDATEVTLTSINGIAFAGAVGNSTDAGLTTLTERMLRANVLFSLGNRVVRVVDAPETVATGMIVGADAPFTLGAVTTITLRDAAGGVGDADYPVASILVFSTATQSFVPLISNATTPVASVEIDAAGNVALFDLNARTVARSTTSLTLPILQIRVETPAGVFESETVFGSTGETIADPNFILVQGAKVLPGPYVSGARTAIVRITEGMGILATIEDLPDLPDGRPVRTAADDEGLFDFIVVLDTDEDAAVVILRLMTAVRAGTLYHKYDENTGSWLPFDTRTNDRIYSAPLPCPAAAASREPETLDVAAIAGNYAWQRADVSVGGMRTGDRCLLLEIHDGADNDADRRANGYVVDLGGLSRAAAADGGDTGSDGGGSSGDSSDSSGSGSSGGGAVEWWQLLLLAGLVSSMVGWRRLRSRVSGTRQHVSSAR